MSDKKVKLLALSGSLRKLSYNTAAINALKVLAPAQVDITIGNISDLPLFNPDREGEYIPSFEALRLALGESDGLIISSPEYAHGISGSLKNALDWLVSGSEFPEIPIMLINTSPRASHAQQALREVVTTMSGKVIDDACISSPLLGSELGSEGIVEHQDISELMRAGLEVFYSKINNTRLSRHSNGELR
jgi:NAD(P)H-dependent FMN reductase